MSSLPDSIGTGETPEQRYDRCRHWHNLMVARFNAALATLERAEAEYRDAEQWLDEARGEMNRAEPSWWSLALRTPRDNWHMATTAQLATRTRKARQAGICPTCRGPIQRGQRIAWLPIPAIWVHSRCSPAVRAARNDED